MGRLVLKRKPGEGVRIGDVVVYVQQTRGGVVSLGIDAPQRIEITRVDSAGNSQTKQKKAPEGE